LLFFFFFFFFIFKKKKPNKQTKIAIKEMLRLIAITTFVIKYEEWNIQIINKVRSFPHTWWTHPSEDIFKYNWNASVNVTKGWVGLGIVVKDCYGLILGAKCITMETVADSSFAEVVGALYAVQSCKEVSFFFFMFFLKGMPIQ
jgi:hypothetical protein